jgi:N-acetylmuramoyl-L-alanine amidase
VADGTVKGTFAALLGVPVSIAILAGVLAWSGGPRERGRARKPESGRRPVPEAPAGPLSGVVVYLSAGHGWLLHREDHDGEPIGWGSQRPRLYGMLEDEWTAAFVADDLAPALEGAGATVLALRERDRNPVSVELEEAGPDVDTFGIDRVVRDASASGGTALRLDPGGAATWVLTVPEDGVWYAYARWVADHRLDAEAVYTVRLGDDVRETVVDQRAHGGHWWPLGDACLPKGSTVEITLTGSGTAHLSADAVRIGGGTATVLLAPYSFTIERLPYAQAAMAHQLERLGGPESLGYYDCGNVVSDMRLRPHWSSWASPPGEDAVYLSIHTNANDARGRAHGLTVFYGYDTDPVTPPQARSIALARALEESVLATVSAADRGYISRGVLPGNFSEISPVHNALPAALLEMGFHDDAEDAKLLQTQVFKTRAAQGIVEGLVRWHERGRR